MSLRRTSKDYHIQICYVDPRDIKKNSSTKKTYRNRVIQGVSFRRNQRGSRNPDSRSNYTIVQHRLMLPSQLCSYGEVRKGGVGNGGAGKRGVVETLIMPLDMRR